MSLIASPKFFNYLIIALFLCAAIRWFFAGDFKQVAYWISAAILNLSTIPK